MCLPRHRSNVMACFSVFTRSRQKNGQKPGGRGGERDEWRSNDAIGGVARLNAAWIQR